jgi:hypothetical protein
MKISPPPLRDLRDLLFKSDSHPAIPLDRLAYEPRATLRASVRRHRSRYPHIASVASTASIALLGAGRGQCPIWMTQLKNRENPKRGKLAESALDFLDFLNGSNLVGLTHKGAETRLVRCCAICTARRYGFDVAAIRLPIAVQGHGAQRQLRRSDRSAPPERPSSVAVAALRAGELR